MVIDIATAIDSLKAGGTFNAASSIYTIDNACRLSMLLNIDTVPMMYRQPAYLTPKERLQLHELNATYMKGTFTGKSLRRFGF